MDFFAHLEQAPDDPILGIVAKFLQDKRDHKVNLSVGVYFDEHGKQVNFDAINTAQEIIAQHFYGLPTTGHIEPADLSLAPKAPKNTTVAYLPATGYTVFNQAIRDLVFPPEMDARKENRIATMESVAGSGGLRLVGDLLFQRLGFKRMLFSNPTWSNHYSIFGSSGLETGAYRYYDREIDGINFTHTLKDLEALGPTDACLFQASCHNPTGYDFTLEQWETILKLAKVKGFGVVFDCAYQGFGDGLDEDVACIRLATKILDEFIVVTSCSKNFGCYGERIGAVHVVAKNETEAKLAISNLQSIANNHYVAPGSNGAYVVATVLTNPELKQQWMDDINAIAKTVRKVRQDFANEMRKHGIDFDFIVRQRGMFSYTNVTPDQVKRLKDEFAVYIVGDGRINVVGLNAHNIPYVAKAFATVIKETQDA